MEDDWQDLDLSGLRLSARAQNNGVSLRTSKQTLKTKPSLEFTRAQQVRLKRSDADTFEPRTGATSQEETTRTISPRRYGLARQERDNTTRPAAPIDKASLPESPQFELGRRLRQGLQPRRHLPDGNAMAALSMNQKRNVQHDEDDLDGLELPKNSGLTLRNFQKPAVPQAEFESDNEDWEEGSLGIRHASTRTPRSNRHSISSIFSSSNVSTDDSQLGLEGLELPAGKLNLRDRFAQTADRRAAGDTIRHVKRPVRVEDPAEGLVVDQNSFARSARFGDTIRGRKSGLPVPARQTSLRGTAEQRQTDASSHTRMTGRNLDIHTPSVQTSSKDRLRSSALATTANVPTTTRRDNQASNSSKPAFLPSGHPGEASYHVSARAQRADRYTDGPSSINAFSPTKRRATASEALRLEAARCNARAHVRAKTYGEGHELDTLEDLPVEVRPSRQSRPPSVPASPAEQAEKLQKYQEKRRSAAASSDTIRPSAATQLRQRPSRPEMSTNNKVDKPRRKHVALPGLISGINAAPTQKREKNMIYNPKTFRWEGNEQDMDRFDSVLQQSPSRLALIAPVRSTQSTVQVANGMVFDPQQMRWVKLSADDDSETDPFEALDDLDDERPATSGTSGNFSRSSASDAAANHFAIGEEFDVGRQFIRKQREEEVGWREQAKGWFKGRRPGMSRQYLQEIYVLLTEDE